MQAGMHGGGQGQMATSMQGMLDNMKQLQGQFNGMMKDPSWMGNNQAMKDFQQACKNLEQMASSYQTMTKNITSMMKTTMAGAKK
jgi:hypothetical protein